jgi:dTMP kinase
LVEGRFIAFEGVEGAGKSTQVARLAERLRVRGIDPLLVREPGGTPLAEAARDLVLHGKEELPAAAELFLYLVARADLVQRVIRPALASGKTVIADRFELSTRAYQVAGRGLPADEVAASIRLATGGLAPDVYIVLDLDFEEGRRRQAAQKKAPDRVERADAAFHGRVAAAFKNVTDPRAVRIDAGASADAVHASIWRALAERFPELR